MATTAHVIPALEVSAPDDNMDILSDTAFDFGDGDGDIDLDLDAAPSVHDDDISLNDAATDGGIDTSEHIDQDDFMADHGDLIEDDDVYNDDTATDPQHVDEGTTGFEADMLAPPDEDLIDYSDDEAQQPVKMHSPSVHEEENVEVSFDLEATSVQIDKHVEEGQLLESATAVHDETQTQDDDAAKNETTEVSVGHEAQDAGLQHEGGGEDAHSEDEGGIALPADDDSRLDNEITPEHQEEQQEEAGEDHESVHHNDQQIELRPVTVNYAGNELWLFKQHDLDDSGDFLLDGLSVAKSSISDLFQACRLSLGDDVSGEHEIGFRFDHLHNLELYEDNTACVAVSLERMVDLYHTLQTQDGNDDPECFYVTLQFRPRFATLLADIVQYAEQGSGYSALDAAVSAGETHFSNVFSSASTDHDHIEWDQDENEEQDASSPVSIQSIAQEEVGADVPEEPHFREVEQQEEEQEKEQGEDFNQEDAPHQESAALLQELEKALDTQSQESYVAQKAAHVDSLDNAAVPSAAEHDEAEHEPRSEAAAERHASESHDERTPDQIAHEKQEAEDFVDYSDDEEQQADKSAPHEASPSSSTVQGDDLTEVQVPNLEHDRHDNVDPAEGGLEEHDDDTTLLTQTQYGDDANHYAFQDYTKTYEQGDLFRDYQADGTAQDLFDASGGYTGNTNQDFADYNFQEMDGEINLGFDEQPLDEANRNDCGGEAYEAVEDVTHADVLLDFDNAPEWAVDADPASNLPGEDAILVHDDTSAHEDEEGGVVEQPGATSSAADLALTSSNDHRLSSPQGQKRSIDEVGDGTEDAPDSTGKSHSHRTQRPNTDLCPPDAKRARV